MHPNAPSKHNSNNTKPLSRGDDGSVVWYHEDPSSNPLVSWVCLAIQVLRCGKEGILRAYNNKPSNLFQFCDVTQVVIIIEKN